MLWDVVIVGAGPIGCHIASSLSLRGYDVLVLEEHPEIGNPSHCAGLFSEHVFEIVDKFAILHEVKRARIYSPNGEFIDIGDDRRRAYVVDRVKFDRELARKAINNGAEIHLKERALKIDNIVKTRREEYRARVIVGADGINSVVRRSMELKIPSMLNASQIIAKYESEDVEKVKIFLGNNIASQFFSWIIPLDSEFAKIGLGSYRHSYPYLKNLMKKLNVKPLALSFGGIPIGMVKKSYERNKIIVGDAAGQVKATTGGGIYPGLKCANCAIKAIDRYLKGEIKDLSSYERCWKSGIGNELKNALYLHRIFKKIKDEEFNAIIRDLKSEEIIKIINDYGDIDYPSKVAWKILKKKPSLLKYIGISARFS